MSLPGMSKHLRMRPVWWRTASRASPRRRTWSSGGAGVAMTAALLRSCSSCCLLSFCPSVHHLVCPWNGPRCLWLFVPTAMIAIAIAIVNRNAIEPALPSQLEVINQWWRGDSEAADGRG